MPRCDPRMAASRRYPSLGIASPLRRSASTPKPNDSSSPPSYPGGFSSARSDLSYGSMWSRRYRANAEMRTPEVLKGRVKAMFACG